VVDQGRRNGDGCHSRLLPGRGCRGAALLAVPSRALWLAAAALVCPWPFCLRHAMPELPPKAFGKLSRTIGSGSAGPWGKARTPLTDAGRASRPDAGADYAELQVTSNFSFLRGASHPDELVMTAA